jgi:hypothetical protein
MLDPKAPPSFVTSSCNAIATLLATACFVMIFTLLPLASFIPICVIAHSSHYRRAAPAARERRSKHGAESEQPATSRVISHIDTSRQKSARTPCVRGGRLTLLYHRAEPRDVHRSASPHTHWFAPFSWAKHLTKWESVYRSENVPNRRPQSCSPSAASGCCVRDCVTSCASADARSWSSRTPGS